MPLSVLASTPDQKLLEIRKTVERGLEQMSQDNDAVSELIRIELAKQHGKEFGYQEIFNRTRLRRRERINETIDVLINHGYLSRRTPFSFQEARRSYLSILSFIDPGVVTYLTGEDHPELVELGFRVEALVHSRLYFQFKNELLKTELSYYKPFKEDAQGNIKYQRGEIDFIVKRGERIVPIEVKRTDKPTPQDLAPLKNLLAKYKKIPFGVMLYGGVPQADLKDRILYWPWWGV